MNIEIIGFLATIISTISLLPLIINIIKKGKTEGLIYTRLGIELLASLLWLIYGLHKKTYPAIIINIINLTLFIILIIIKFHNEKKKKI